MIDAFNYDQLKEFMERVARRTTSRKPAGGS
jgi:hypothetical protein